VTTEAVSRDRREAQRAFVEAEYSGLVRYAFRLCGDEHLARDVAQEAFVRLFGRWISVRDPHAYVYMVATNYLRRTFKRRGYEDAALAKAHARPELVVGPEELGLRDVVDRLPRRWREVILLYYFADLPVRTVAAQLRTPEGTVRRLLTEARAALALSLEERP